MFPCENLKNYSSHHPNIPLSSSLSLYRPNTKDIGNAGPVPRCSEIHLLRTFMCVAAHFMNIHN